MKRSSRTRTAVLALLAAAALSACQSGDAGPTATASSASAAGDAEKGKQTYATMCSTCHGPEGEGVKGLGKSLVDSTWVGEQSDDALFQVVVDGRAPDDPLNTTGVAMPPRGGNAALTDGDVRDVVAYVRSINKAKK